MKSLLFVALIAISLTCANALTLSNTLGNNMVLQRAPAQAVIWGFDVAGSKVVVTVSGGTPVAALTGTNGIFSVQLATHQAGGPYTITVESSAGATTQLTNVMFGDVYVCSGQSNMQFTVHSVFNATAEIAAAANYPQIRLFSVGTINISLTPVEQLLGFQLGWSVASPANVGYADWSYFSAVCWFYGRDLANHFPGLPIGLISSNWGGTYVQAWSSPDALAKCPNTLKTENSEISENLEISEISDAKNVRGKFTAITSDALNPNQPSVLWNAMIVPFLRNPIKGVLWYQGEQNSGDPTGYACQFPAMIADWRVKWAGNTNFPFFFVQLAPWGPGGVTIPETRQAQLKALALPNVGFATAVDLGDAGSPFGNIHPRDKQTVGSRLLLSARAIAYGETGFAYKGPIATGATVSSQSPNVRVSVAFEADSVAGGLVLSETPSCPIDAASCGFYTILLSDNKSYNATGVVAGNTLTVTATAAASLTVKAVNYAWAAWPICNLYNKAGLPAVPFQFLF